MFPAPLRDGFQYELACMFNPQLQLPEFWIKHSFNSIAFRLSYTIKHSKKISGCIIQCFMLQKPLKSE